MSETTHESIFNVASQMLDEFHGVSVTLKRGGRETAAITARRENRAAEVFPLGEKLGLNTETDVIVYRLPAVGVVIGGETFKPRKGDVIVEGAAEFTIQPPDDRNAAVRPADDNWWICNTKQTK